MKSAIIKRSIELNGHKTSVSLEDEFWDCLRAIADAKKVSMPRLLQIIDGGRKDTNLSSAIRVFVLTYYCAHVLEPDYDPQQTTPPPMIC